MPNLYSRTAVSHAKNRQCTNSNLVDLLFSAHNTVIWQSINWTQLAAGFSSLGSHLVQSERLCAPDGLTGCRSEHTAVVWYCVDQLLMLTLGWTGLDTDAFFFLFFFFGLANYPKPQFGLHTPVKDKQNGAKKQTGETPWNM